MDRRYTNPDAMFDGRSYPKGAWIVHMLRHRLGEDSFWKGIKNYAVDNRFRSVESYDLRRSLERASGRDLERFFYDWVERPGSPNLEVTTEYLADSDQAKLTVKQTQGGEAFEFPLKIVLTCAGGKEPVVLDEMMREKELNYRLPLPGRLERIDIDPDQAVLMELKETKAKELWRAQLLESPTVPARLRAVKHFSESKLSDDHELLTQAFAREKFWGVKKELADALGNVKGVAAKKALFNGMKDPDARIRRSCVDALGKFGEDAEIATFVKEKLAKGDASYAVEGALLSAYSQQHQKDAVAVISPWLSKPSHRDTFSVSALTALGATDDPAVLATLLSWTKPEKPNQCQAAALRGLSQLAKSKRMTDEHRKQIVDMLLGALKSEDRMKRFSAIRALPELGALAAPALPTLDKLAQDQSLGRMSQMIKSAADKIRAESGSKPASDVSEVSRLRDEVKRLERSQDDLRKRLEKFENAKR